MKKNLLILTSLIYGFLASASGVMAIVDPGQSDNNKVGVHILQPAEIEAAAKLVNRNGEAAWGYVVVPIQATDRDRVKWQDFMKRAKELKVIPIVRVATFVSDVHWEEPNNFDLIDFANFLNDLSWPVKNRYVVIFNEVNRADEYGGYVAPARYADILVNAIRIFKERSEDFFMLPAGLDNAAASSGQAMKWSEYLRAMQRQQPEVFSLIDGWVSHAYPNYAFAGSPLDQHDHSVASYRHDLRLLSAFTDRKLPVFITETGWNSEKVGEEAAAANLSRAFAGPWRDEQIVSVSSFLLMAGEGPFTGFSLLGSDNQPKKTYNTVAAFASQGRPVLADTQVAQVVKGVTTNSKGSGIVWERIKAVIVPDVARWWSGVLRFFNKEKEPALADEYSEVIVGGMRFEVEIADSEVERRQGLSGREELAEGTGMLFIFQNPGKYGFWMKQMKFDIDIVFIRNRRVIAVLPGDDQFPQKVINPPSEIDMVLEVTAGSGIKAGELVIVQ